MISISNKMEFLMTFVHPNVNKYHESSSALFQSSFTNPFLILSNPKQTWEEMGRMILTKKKEGFDVINFFQSIQNVIIVLFVKSNFFY